MASLKRKRAGETRGGLSTPASLAQCKRLKIQAELGLGDQVSLDEHLNNPVLSSLVGHSKLKVLNPQVRSNDGATKALDGNSSLAAGDAHIEGVAAGAEADAAHLNEGNTRVMEEEIGREDSERLENNCEVDHDHVQDTVGVVVLDQAGNVASTVSSGGIALKQPGR